MQNKYSSDLKRQINKIINYLNTWKELFHIKVDYYEEGWAISLREICIYPRYIVIFKPYTQTLYSIKSFEIQYNQHNNEILKVVYHNENRYNLNDLKTEVKEIIYGKDIAYNFMKKFLEKSP